MDLNLQCIEEQPGGTRCEASTHTSRCVRQFPAPEFEPSFPYGWDTAEVEANPMGAILEHAYGNCPCNDSDECLRNIAAIGEKAKG